MRTSARAVRTHSESLLKDTVAPRNSDFEQRLGFVVEGANQINLIVDGLTNYSIALQTNSVTFSSIALDVLVRSVLAKLRKELQQSGAEVIYGELPTVMGDLDRLLQVFEHLLRNALVHRGEDAPHIQISAGKQAGDWLVAVRDNGPGVETAYLETIFLPFERLQRQRPGVGLGLTVSRAIVERHGGVLWAESKAGEGATFFFTLPD